MPSWNVRNVPITPKNWTDGEKMKDISLKASDDQERLS